jgi:hypothetical protein
MEPLHPDVRAELKRAHPGLDDATIDEYERLTQQRMTLDPARERSRIAELDARRMHLVTTRMPQLASVQSASTARRVAEAAASRPLPSVTVRTLDRPTGEQD